MSISTSKSNDRIRITDFSLFALFWAVGMAVFIIYAFSQLGDDWSLPESMNFKSNGVKLSRIQETILFFSVNAALFLAAAYMATYTRVLFDLSEDVVYWRRVSIFGSKAAAYPLSSVTNIVLESSVKLGVRSKDQYHSRFMLCVDGRFVPITSGETTLTGKELKKYQNMIEDVRNSIWPNGRKGTAPEDASPPTTDDPKQTLLKSGLSEPSPGVYVSTRFHLGGLIALSTLLFLLYHLLAAFPQMRDSFSAAMEEPDVVQVILSVVGMTILPLLLIGASILFSSIGLLDRIAFDTHHSEVRTFHLGYLGWSGRRHNFDDVAEIQIDRKDKETDSRFGLLGRYTQVTLRTRDNHTVAVNDKAYGIEHQVSCTLLTAALSQLLNVPANTTEPTSPETQNPTA